MALFESIAAILSTKAGVTAAGLAVAAGSVGAAGAAGALPDDVQSAFDRAISGEEVGEQAAEEAEATAEEAQQNAEHGDDNERASLVHDVLTGDADLEPGDEGFGQAVAENAQEGGAAFGADVASTASDGRSDAGADAAAEGQANAEGGDEADAGADNADVADDYRSGAGQPEDLPEQSNTGTSTATNHAGR